ncbi:hypothetical protein VTO42DRAFT_8660 [Malbranchea cinnamomea]
MRSSKGCVVQHRASVYSSVDVLFPTVRESSSLWAFLGHVVGGRGSPECRDMQHNFYSCGHRANILFTVMPQLRSWQPKHQDPTATRSYQYNAAPHSGISHYHIAGASTVSYRLLKSTSSQAFRRALVSSKFTPPMCMAHVWRSTDSVAFPTSVLGLLRLLIENLIVQSRHALSCCGCIDRKSTVQSAPRP